MPRVLVTGAAGFVGRHTVHAFDRAGWQVRTLVRARTGAQTSPDERIVGDLATARLFDAMRDVDCVVHLAARAHRMDDRPGDQTRAAYRAANVDVTTNVATAARDARVTRFVLVSSAKVFGEERDRPYTPTDIPAPADDYGRTKLESERQLLAIAGSQMETVIVRPPMVYGPGGKGNVPRLMRLARLATRWPLPFAAASNRRSVLYVGNLASALVHCATNPALAGQTLLVSDGDAPSISELLRRLAAHSGGAARLYPMPVTALRALLTIAGRGDEARRLFGSLVLDDSAIRSSGWRPPFSLDDGLRATAQGLT